MINGQKAARGTHSIQSGLDKVFLSLGSNLGDRMKMIRSAFSDLSAMPACQEIEISPVYETEAWGKIDQQNFLNCVVKMMVNRPYSDTSSTHPGEFAYIDQFMQDLRYIEESLGRERDAGKWSPRTIDIDILLYNDLCYESPILTVPHPRMSLRNFVLIPFLDLAPEIQIPGTGNSVKMLLQNCKDGSRVSLFQHNPATALNKPTTGTLA